MLNFPRWKVWGITLLCVIGVALAIPSLFPESQVAKWPGWVPSARISLGLDLAGGSHLLFEADTREVLKQQVELMGDNVRVGLRRQDPPIQIANLSTANGKVSFVVRNPAQVDAAVEFARGLTQPAGLGARDWTVNVFDQNRVEMSPTKTGLDSALDHAMTSAREVIYNRINPNGAKEVTIIRQGSNRILVEVPGLQDPEGLKRLIGKTAKLEFKLVDESVTTDQLASGRGPVGSEILPMQGGKQRIGVFRRAIVTGDQLARATPGFDESNQSTVNITFNGSGGKAFGKVTQENVHKRFAIILDGIVLSAPVIQEPILGGQARITGSFTPDSAKELSVQLASGSLPINLKVIEERTVGPELGRDSIYKGAKASIFATLAVILFMLVTYGRFGVYATIALILNALMILGIMALFNATLTLPGIAGFVLTIGAAVDANVLINERIREELKRGRRVLEALEHGYTEAQTAIFDANITNVIAAVIMYGVGSGPVKGFAVVLLIGIVTSVFTAVNVTRMLVALWARKKRPRELHI